MRLATLMHAHQGAGLGLPYGAGDRPEHGPWHDRLVVAAAALATLLVIVMGMSLPREGPGYTDPSSELTELGRRAVDSLPNAYQAGDSVIVPAADDPSIMWVDEVPATRIDGVAVPLYVRGLVGYSLLNASRTAPGWVDEITDADRIYVDVGSLFIACMRWPGAEGCGPTLLMQNEGRFYIYRSGIGSENFLESRDMEGYIYDAVVAGERERLVLGGLGGTETEEVRLLLQDGTEVGAHTSKLVVPGATVWWATARQPVESVTAYRANGEAVDWLRAVG